MKTEIFRTGDAVRIECAGQSVSGLVLFASGNGKSLMLSFDAMIDGCVGMMPVLQDDDGTYSALMTGNAVKLHKAG